MEQRSTALFGDVWEKRYVLVVGARGVLALYRSQVNALAEVALVVRRVGVRGRFDRPKRTRTTVTHVVRAYGRRVRARALTAVFAGVVRGRPPADQAPADRPATARAGRGASSSPLPLSSSSSLVLCGALDSQTLLLVRGSCV